MIDATFEKVTREDWLKRVDGVVKGPGFAEGPMWKSADGHEYPPLFAQMAGPRAARNMVAPWTVFQRVDHPDAAKANAQARDDLDNGATGLVLAGSGIAMARVLRDVALHAISLRVEGDGAEALAALIARQPIDPERLAVSFGAKDAEVARRLAAQGFVGPLLEADGRNWHDRGVSPGEELGAVLGQAVAQLRSLDGMSDMVLAQAVGVTLAADQDMFMTIAKFRAMRLLWGRVLEACGLPQTELSLHAETSRRMQAAMDPHSNILRATAAVFGAGLGGASSICVLPFSQAQGLPNAFARRVARNVQNVLLEESNLWRVADPASGAGYVEQMTQDLCAVAWRVFQKAERGEWPKGNADSTQSLPVIGTTKYPLSAEHAPEVEAL
jgi:methylmalonyl-CoA mutase